MDREYLLAAGVVVAGLVIIIVVAVLLAPARTGRAGRASRLLQLSRAVPTLLIMCASGALAGAALSWVLMLFMALISGLPPVPFSDSAGQALGTVRAGGGLVAGLHLPPINSPLVGVGALAGGMVGLALWLQQVRRGILP